MKCLLCSIGLVVGTRVALAAPNYTATVVKNGSALTCKIVDHKVALASSLGLRVVVNDNLVRKGVSVVLDNGPSKNLTMHDVAGASGAATTFERGAAQRFTLKIDTDQGSAECDSIGLALGTPALLSGADISDDEAARWWGNADGLAARDRFVRAARDRGLPHNAVLMVHLPSGRLATPSPSSLRDRSVVQVVVISTHASGFNMVSKGCVTPTPLRVLGGQQSDPPKTQSDRVDSVPEARTASLALVGAGAHLECGAGELTYDLTYGNAGDEKVLSTTSVTIRPTFTLAVLTAIGFDTTIKHDYAAVRARDLEAGHVIGNRHTKVGPSVLVGAQWMLGNVDYSDMRWYNYIANPFVAIDAAAPLSGFVVGDTLTLTGGVSLALGLAVHPGVRLKGTRLYDPIADNAEPQKDTDWSSYRLGFFVGIALDSKVFKALSTPQ